MPKFCLIGGPNGSGKSSVLSKFLNWPSATHIDPDAIARRINPNDVTAAAIEAAREAIALTRRCIEERRDFVVETTLAGNGPLATLQKAKDAGFDTLVLFVALDSVLMNLKRVNDRAVKGGHDVPDDDIRRRYERSLANAPAAIALADEAKVFDNTGHDPRLIITTKNGLVISQAPDLPPWAANILKQLP
jgi:predicted ABC-type ATPase